MSEPHHYPNYLFLLIPFLVFFRKPRWIVWLAALGIAYVLIIASTSWIARYLLPAYPPLTIVAAYTLTAISERISLLRKLPIFLVAGLLAVVVSTSVLSLRKFSSFRFLAGTASRREVVELFTHYRPLKFINNTLPHDARVMFLGAQLSYGVERPYISDESWFSTKWRRLLVHNDSLEDVNRDLKQQGFTHILFSPGIFTYAAARGTEGTGGLALMALKAEQAPAELGRLGPEYLLLRNWATFALYQQQFLETVYSDANDYFLYKIK